MTANIHILLHIMQVKIYFSANYFQNNLYQFDYQLFNFNKFRV